MVNQQHWHYDRHWGWQPIKARKLEVLEFIHDMEIVTAYDLIDEFGYTNSSARCRLSQLKKEGFIASCGRGQWCLTDKAYRKLRYHGVLQRKEAEELRRQRQAEGRVWFIDVGGIRTAKNVHPLDLNIPSLPFLCGASAVIGQVASRPQFAVICKKLLSIQQ